MKSILWLTADYFIDVDFLLVPYIKSNYPEYKIKWVIICGVDSKIEVNANLKCSIFKFKHRARNPLIVYEYHKMFSLLKNEKYDLIYSDVVGFPYHYPLLYKFAKHTPIIHAAHNVIPYPVWPWWLKIYVKYIFKTNQYFQMFSHFTAEYFKKQYPNKSFFYCPMTLKGYGEVSTDNYDIDKSKLNLLFFGNVVLNKRLDLLIQAVKNLPKEIKNKVHLTIAGKCSAPQQYIEQICNDESISVYFKRIDDCEIAELFTKHDFLVLPYQDVAQSGPHMIAYYYNLPVIASDIDGFKERVEDGVNGMLFKSKSADDLKEKIIKAANMTDDEKSKMKENLKAFAEENFGLEKVSQKYVEYFNSIMQ